MFFSFKNISYIFLFFVLISPLELKAQYNMQSGDTDVNLIVEGCNNNSICEVILGEDISNCPLDCPIITPPITSTTTTNETTNNSGKSGGRVNFLEYDGFPNIFQPNVLYPEVTNANVSMQNKSVYLDWKNPTLADFEYIRVVKNNFYTTDPYQGEIVYEGINNNVLDKIEFFDKNYFYSIFVKYKDVGFSKGIGFTVNSKMPSIVEDINNEIESVVFEDKKNENVIFSNNFNIYDVIFSQDGHKLRWKKDVVQSLSRNPILVSFNKRDFFGEVEDVYLYVDFYDKDDKFFRKDILKLDYFSINQSYQSQIRQIVDSKKLNFRLSVINQQKEESFVTGSIKLPLENEQIVKKSQNNNRWFLLLIIIIILLLIIFFNRKRTDK